MREIKENPVCWFELPVTDMERAIGFYEYVFGVEMECENKSTCADTVMIFFPHSISGKGVFGSLTKSPYMQPSVSGAMLYFSSTVDDVALELSRVEFAGGKILVQKTFIAEDIGYFGIVLDTEGNRIGIMSTKYSPI